MHGKPRVMIIEDERNLAELISQASKQCDYETFIALTPDEIEHGVEHFRPNLIILDLIMPDMDGIEVLQFLREKLFSVKVAIISGSSSGSRDIVERLGSALGLEVVANIAKPFRLNELRIILTDIRQTLSMSSSHDAA